MSTHVQAFRAISSIPIAASCLIGLIATASGQIDKEINRQVWKQKFGVLDAQMNEQAPYAGWLSQDADGDGVRNRDELLAGTNPFKKLPDDARFRPTAVATDASSLSLTFPTVAGKLYGVECSETLADSWSHGSLPGITGDGTEKTLVVPMSSGKFFKLSVTDQATQGDMVSDWAKIVLGLSANTPIGSQTSFNHTSLASNLQSQNVVSLSVIDTTATQPVDASTPAGDFALIRITRSGHMLLGDVTVPLPESGTAVEGVDFATLPPSVTFPAGVNSLDIRITPHFNANRTSSATVFLTAGAPGSAGASGNYTLGGSASAGATIYPAANPSGTGLTANYYAGSNTTYTNPLNFGGLAGTYVYTKANTTSGTAVITFAGTPATPFTPGSNVTLQFTSSTLNTSPYNTPLSYTVIAPVTSNSFAVGITGTSVPGNSSGTPSVVIGSFSAPVTRLDPVVDFIWGTGTPAAPVPVDNFTARWTGQVLPQYSQKYYFATKADNGSKLWVNNQLVVDQWTSTSEKTGSIDLQAGVLYDLKMESNEITGSAEVHLYWYSDDQAKQIIPTNRLFPTISGSTPIPGNPPAGKPAITSPTDVVFVLGSNPSVNIPVTTSNGGTVSASGLPPWLSLVNGILTGTPPGPGIYQFTVTTTNSEGSGSAVITLEILAAANQLTRDLWTTGVTGSGLPNVPWTTAPTISDTVSTAEDTTTYPTNTGERLRGYFTAPVTGNYYFWIAASSAAELWISNDSEPVNKVRRASVTNSAARTWNSQATQKSPWLSLVGGKKYYIEALHNTGSSGAGNHLSVAWFLDPTGTTPNPLPNGSPAASAGTGGILPSHALSPWDNPPTTTIPGTLFVTNLQGAPGLGNITGTGGSFLRVNGSSAVLQLNFSGLTSGAISKKIYNSANQVIFDLDAQDRNYPALRTTDGGYTWNLQPADLTDLNSGEVYLSIATVNHPDGELSGTFGKTAGSQTAPAVPAYPSWVDQHTTSDAANSRFLAQATFGPGPADMAAIKASGYRPWIEAQMDESTTPPTHNLPDLLANIGTDPGNQYPSTLLFKSWWKNAVTAPDQLRQRAAFALSEILVVSDVGPLNNNGRVLADYYDMLLDHSFGNFRDILKQVTLSPAMGVYLDMRGNYAGSIVTGVHPNENYAREVLQLFSAGLYRVWPDGTLVLDSHGNAIPTYDQGVITGLARVFTGWNWGQPLNGTRLPTASSPATNYLDPMVLVSTKHELGTKILLDNVMLPAATVTSQSDTSTDPNSTYTVQYTHPVLGQGNLLTALITNQYDLNGIKDLEATLDNIMSNSATGPYICRQLIQRLVTSHPTPDYLHRVVRAFNGGQNVDGVRTGVVGDMKDVFRAILLDHEARDTAPADDSRYGKQREPVLRITGPARSFPATGITGATYRGLGYQQLLVTTTAPHRLGESQSVYLDGITDLTPDGALVPTTGSYTVKNTIPTYNITASSSLVTINAAGYQAGDVVKLQFTSSSPTTTPNLNAPPYNTLQSYTLLSATPTSFIIDVGTTFTRNFSGNTSMPYNFTVDGTQLSSVNYNVAGSTATITASGYVTGQKLYLRFATGGLLGAGYDRAYTISGTTGTTFTVDLGSVPANLTSGKVLIPRLTGGYKVTTANSISTITFYTAGNHNLAVDDPVQINFLIFNTGTPATDGVYTVTAVNGPTVFSVQAPSVISNGTQGGSGMVGYPLSDPPGNRNGTLDINLNTWNLTTTQTDLNQTPLNSATVFNFFYPDYQYPGEMARAGMTTPEFQLSNDSNTMNLTNAITTAIIGSGNANEFSSYKSNAITLDLGPYFTPAQTSDSGIPALVDTLGILLTGGSLTTSARTTVIDYAKSLPYTTPTSAQMRDRVRGIVHLIVTSAEFAIQK